MKKFFFALAGVLILLLPTQATDIGDLRPVGLLLVHREGELLHITADTGDTGFGKTIEEAAEDLRLCAPGEVFLDTAGILVISEDTLETLPELEKLLRPAVRIVMTDATIDPSETFAYLQAHPTKYSFVNQTGSIPRLHYEGGQYRLE